MKVSNKLLEIKKTNSDCASYTGTVTIASYLGDRLIQKETHHNAGLTNLFKFISSCLQGNWHEAKFKKPCKLVLLKEGEEEKNVKGGSTPINPDAKDNENRHYWSSTYAISSPIMYTNAAVSEFTNGDNGPESSVTYHFRIPFLSLVSGSNIKKLLLLPAISSDYLTDACAYFKLNEPITVPEASGNFTVIIEWTLTFVNG